MDIISLVFYFVIIIPSAILHEYAHGFMALQLGDHTAEYAGRLTLDPRAHIDRWGTVLMPLLLFFLTNGRFLFAYAKPVPYNPYNLKNQKWGPAAVAVAGPMANLFLAACFGALIKIFPLSAMASFFGIIVYANIMLMVFNLLPFPPLDGSKILFAILPDSAHGVRMFLERYGYIIMLFFVFFLFEMLSPVIGWLYNLLV